MPFIFLMAISQHTFIFLSGIIAIVVLDISPVPMVPSGSHGPLPTAAVLRGGIRGTPWCAPTGLVVG
jgi:hypothetical protein